MKDSIQGTFPMSFAFFFLKLTHLTLMVTLQGRFFFFFFFFDYAGPQLVGS